MNYAEFIASKQRLSEQGDSHARALLALDTGEGMAGRKMGWRKAKVVA